jgi:hypothetical protein
MSFLFGTLLFLCVCPLSWQHLCLCTSLYDSVSVKRSWRLRERILLHFLYLHVYGEGTHVCGHASTCAHAQRGQGTTFGICPSQKHPLAFEVWFLIVLELAQLAVSEASLADQQALVSISSELGFRVSDIISSLFIRVLGMELRPSCLQILYQLSHLSARSSAFKFDFCLGWGILSVLHGSSGDQRATLRSQFSFSITRIPGIELRLSGLVVDAFPYLATSPA